MPTPLTSPIVFRNPLYQQIKQILLDEIRQGLWKAGEQLPTESALAERFGISVGTVRRALGSLEDEGIINRREGSGTFVRTYKGTGSSNQFQIFSDIDGKPRGSRKELIALSTVPAPDFVADALGLAHNTPLLLMVRKLFGDTGHGDELITVDESYLLPDRFVGLTAEHFNKHFRHDDSLYKFYDREFNVVIIRQNARFGLNAYAPKPHDAYRCQNTWKCCVPIASRTTSPSNLLNTASIVGVRAARRCLLM